MGLNILVCKTSKRIHCQNLENFSWYRTPKFTWLCRILFSVNFTNFQIFKTFTRKHNVKRLFEPFSCLSLKDIISLLCRPNVTVLFIFSETTATTILLVPECHFQILVKKFDVSKMLDYNKIYMIYYHYIYYKEGRTSWQFKNE